MDEVIKAVSHTYIFPLVIFIIMFGLGMALNFTMIRDILVKPRALVIGLAGQLLLLPLAAFAVAAVGPWGGVVALGLVVIAVCPGGSTSNAIVFAIRGGNAQRVFGL